MGTTGRPDRVLPVLRLPAVRGAAAPRRVPVRRLLLPPRSAGGLRAHGGRPRSGSATCAPAAPHGRPGAGGRPRLVRLGLPDGHAAGVVPLPFGAPAEPAGAGAPPRRQVRRARGHRSHGGARRHDAAGPRPDLAAHAHRDHVAHPRVRLRRDVRRVGAGRMGPGRQRRLLDRAALPRQRPAGVPAALLPGGGAVPPLRRGRDAQRLRRPLLVPLSLPARGAARAARQGAGAAPDRRRRL